MLKSQKGHFVKIFHQKINAWRNWYDKHMDIDMSFYMICLDMSKFFYTPFMGFFIHFFMENLLLKNKAYFLKNVGKGHNLYSLELTLLEKKCSQTKLRFG